MATKLMSLGAIPVSPMVNGIHGSKDRELHNNSKDFHINFKKFYGIEATRVDRAFHITLSDLSYLPKVDNPRADWVVTAALNSFRAFQSADLGIVRHFATIGTGSGTDVVAALDTFPKLSGIAMTDLHDEVVETAKRNVLSATNKADHSVKDAAMRSVALAGDILLPLQFQEPFELIYENLPNIPLPASVGGLDNGQASSTYVGDRTADKVPPFVSAALLELHYLCLRQAQSFGLLSPGGAILSSMGGRVPLRAMLDMADAAGYTGRILVLSWKEQSEPESVIGGYAKHQESGLGPFYFYPTAALDRVFSDRTPAGAGLCASQIEEELLPVRLDAVKALQMHRRGVAIGHTVVVMASVLNSVGS